MTRSSTKELITPFENPKRVSRSKKRIFETPGLVESSSPKLDLFFDIKEHSEEETTEIMIETMEQYMSKTRGNYGSGVVTQDQVMLQVFPMSLIGAASRWLKNEPSGSITNWETLKTKFLNKYCPPARTAKKIKEVNNFQQEHDESLFRAWERFKELLMKCPQTPSKARSTETFDELAAIEAQLNNLGREIKKVNEKVYAAQVGCERTATNIFGSPPINLCERQFSSKHGLPILHHALTMELLTLHVQHKDDSEVEENSNIIKEIRASTDAAIRNQGASIKTLEIQIGQMSKVLQEKGIEGLPSLTEPNPRDHVKSISTTKTDSSEIRRIGCSPYTVLGPQHRSIFSETVLPKATTKLLL
ncbi:putative reverse transcriptase domain-containing protein [Tanacetum coccineum]